MLTRGFIQKVHEAFDELNYRVTDSVDFDEFDNAAARTLTLCQELDDAIYAIRMYQFCLQKWAKIEKIFERKKDVFKEYEYEGNSLLTLVSEDDAIGTFYVTNGINKRVQDVLVASQSFDDIMIGLDYKNGRFRAFDDGEFYLRYSKMTATKMKLFNNQEQCLCNIVLSENMDVFLEQNHTQYEIVLYEGFMGIYNRNYIDSLNETDDIDFEKAVAAMEWDIIGKNSSLGVTKLDVFKEDVDLELLVLFATSAFLLFQRFDQHDKQMSRMAMMSGMMAMRNANRISSWSRR